MRIFIGSDHAGFKMKMEIIEVLEGKGFRVVDVGCYSEERCSYAQYGHTLAMRVLSDKEGSIGIGICGSGHGIAMVLNRHPGIRAARCVLRGDAELSRLHNNANVLILPGRRITLLEAVILLNEFLETDFEGGRHEDRIRDIEIFPE